MHRLTGLGLRIKEWLLRQGMTQRELAARIGTSEQYLSKILRGQKPAGKYLAAIAEVLGVDVEELKELAA